MSARESDLLPLLLGSFCIIFQLFLMRWVFWNYPLHHGRGFFLGVKVAPGFYEGPGAQWLRRYRTLLLAVHAIMVFVFIALVASHRWNDMPIMAPVIVGLLFAMLGGFTLWTRHSLASAPPKHSSIAIPFETRRFRDYVSWRLEGLLVLLLAACWLLLFFQGDVRASMGLARFNYLCGHGLASRQNHHRPTPFPATCREDRRARSMAGSGSTLLANHDRTHALVLCSSPCGVFSRTRIACGEDDGLVALAILQHMYRDLRGHVDCPDSG